MFGRMQFETACSHWMFSHILSVYNMCRKLTVDTGEGGLFYGCPWFGGWVLPMTIGHFLSFLFRASWNFMRESPYVSVFGSIHQGAGGAENREPHNVT